MVFYKYAEAITLLSQKKKNIRSVVIKIHKLKIVGGLLRSKSSIKETLSSFADNAIYSSLP